jgi:hypothetical protein
MSGHSQPPEEAALGFSTVDTSIAKNSRELRVLLTKTPGSSLRLKRSDSTF